MRSYYKVMRGFVFWYDLDKRVNKNTNPTVVVNGKQYPDRRQYGPRHWLVVSCDACNGSSDVVTVVPITTSKTKTKLPTHVNVTFEGRELTVLCEQPMSINKVELTDFVCSFSEEIMKQVDKGLKSHLGIKDECMYSDGQVGKALSRIEEVIDNIIRERISSTYKARQVDVDDYVIRVAEGIENLIGKTSSKKNTNESMQSTPKVESRVSDSDKEPKKVNTKATNKSSMSGMSAIEKFNKRYPGVSKQEKVVSSTSSTVRKSEDVKKGSKRSWDTGTMKEFLSDCDNMATTDIMVKWGIPSAKTVYQYKYTFKNKLKADKK